MRRDDLAPARGMIAAAIVGLVIWAAILSLAL